MIASFLYADDALAPGATTSGMESYPVSITHAFIQPRPLSDYGLDEDCGWKVYYARHLARLPSLKVPTVYFTHRKVLAHAIFWQPCKRIRSIMLAEGNPHGPDMDQFKPSDPHPQGRPSLLHLAMRKGRLPCLEQLEVAECTDLSIATEAVRTGHFTRVKELQLKWYEDETLQLRPLPEAFKAHGEKLNVLALEINQSDDMVTQRLMHELLASPYAQNSIR